MEFEFSILPISSQLLLNETRISITHVGEQSGPYCIRIFTHWEQCDMIKKRNGPELGEPSPPPPAINAIKCVTLKESLEHQKSWFSSAG